MAPDQPALLIAKLREQLSVLAATGSQREIDAVLEAIRLMDPEADDGPVSPHFGDLS
jgi:hypothetical protein